VTDGTNGEDEEGLVVREFVAETTENLEQADQCLLDLERTPGDLAPVRILFRAVHTLKSSCGWLGFGQLEQLAHAAESLLAPIRSKERPVAPEIVEALMATVDLTRKQLAAINADGKEPLADGELDRWTDRLRALVSDGAEVATSAPQETQGSGTSEPAAPPVAPQDSRPPSRSEVTPATAPVSVAAEAAELSVRVDVKLLDELMKMVGELVLTRNQVGQFVDTTDSPPLIAASQRLNVVTSELQDRIMMTRMQPLSHIWGRFPRIDRMMPGMDGIAALAELKGSPDLKDIPVIFMTASAQSSEVASYLDKGAVGVITKPFDPMTLPDEIHKILKAVDE